MSEWIMGIVALWIICRRKIIWRWIETFIQSFTFDVDGFFEEIRNIYKK